MASVGLKALSGSAEHIPCLATCLSALMAPIIDSKQLTLPVSMGITRALEAFPNALPAPKMVLGLCCASELTFTVRVFD
jgi:hypothetical protein